MWHVINLKFIDTFYDKQDDTLDAAHDDLYLYRCVKSMQRLLFCTIRIVLSQEPCNLS